MAPSQPILHLNGFKISNPTLLARIERPSFLTSLALRLHAACGRGDDPMDMHQQMAATPGQVRVRN